MMQSFSQFNQLILDNLAVGVILLNEELHIQYMNPATQVMLSTSIQRCHQEAISTVIEEVSDHPPSLQQLLEKKQPYVKHDAVFNIFDNTEILVDYVVTPIIDNKKTYLLLEIVPLDTLRVSKEDVLHTQQLGNKLLLQGLAHEIKNPLGGIQGAAQLLSSELDNSPLQEYTSVLINEAKRLSQLVDQLIGTHYSPKLEKTNIHEVLEYISSLVLAEAPDHVTLIRDYDPSLPELLIDPKQMIQAFLNIARNALQALIEKNIESPRITLKTRILRQFNIGITRYRLVINVDIIDNGVGIPSTIKDTLFFPMVSARANGSGLGLAIAQEIITRHHGAIECSSKLNQTIFSIFLPIE